MGLGAVVLKDGPDSFHHTMIQNRGHCISNGDGSILKEVIESNKQNVILGLSL